MFWIWFWINKGDDRLWFITFLFQIWDLLSRELNLILKRQVYDQYFFAILSRSVPGSPTLSIWDHFGLFWVHWKGDIFFFLFSFLKSTNIPKQNRVSRVKPVSQLSPVKPKSVYILDNQIYSKHIMRPQLRQRYLTIDLLVDIIF